MTKTALLCGFIFDNVCLPKPIQIIKMKNQRLISSIILAISILAASGGQVLAQSIDQVRWKSTEQVRAILGEPKSVSSPVGTHATYVMWQYEGFTVAFANGKAFHLFRKDSLNRIQLEENR